MTASGKVHQDQPVLGGCGEAEHQRCPPERRRPEDQLQSAVRHSGRHTPGQHAGHPQVQ